MKMELVESREGQDHNSEVDVDTQDFKSDSADSLEREDTQVFECHQVSLAQINLQSAL